MGKGEFLRLFLSGKNRRRIFVCTEVEGKMPFRRKEREIPFSSLQINFVPFPWNTKLQHLHLAYFPTNLNNVVNERVSEIPF